MSPPSLEDAGTIGMKTSVSLNPASPEIRFTAVVTEAETELPRNGANVLFAVLEETYLIDGTTDSSGTYTTAVPITRTQWETYINDEEWGGVRWEISHYPEGYPQRLVYLNPGPSFEDIVDNGISITIALEKPTPQPRANILLNTQVPALVANGGAWTGTAQNILPVDSEGFGGLNVHFQRAVSQALDGVTFQSGDIATYSCELELKSTTGQQFGILYYRGSTLLSGTHTVYVDGVKIAEGISGASWIVIGDNASHYVEVLTTLTGAPERLNLIVGADVTQGGDMKRIKLESSTEADGYRASQWVPNVND